MKHIENQFEDGMSWENYGRPKGVPKKDTWDLEPQAKLRLALLSHSSSYVL
jgi:hypothetical protein